MSGRPSHAVSEDSSCTPLVVDLDGTLLRSDVLLESTLALISKNPLFALKLPVWLLRGKAALKSEIASRVSIDVATLPYNMPLVEFLRSERSSGRRLVLATASNERFAQQIAEHLELFDDVLASDAEVNLSSRNKLRGIQARLGESEFDYAGNSAADIAIWERCRRALVVDPTQAARRWSKSGQHDSQLFESDTKPTLKTYLRALRPHQWLKNLLLFIPLIMGHEYTDPALMVLALCAFVSFSLCASSVYVLNDLIDLRADRRHSSKKSRPFASGDVPIVHGLALIPCLIVAAIGIGLLLPWEFMIVLAAYYAATLAYSLRLKRAALVDVIVLAGLYTLRIIAGAAAVAIVPSFWLLAFSMFLFLSLALVKRYTELRMTLNERGAGTAHGRGYGTGDLEGLSQFGTSTAIASVLVLALYINGDTVAQTYRYPQLIWLLCPLLLYLIGRIWLLARRDELHEDPVVFAMRDRRSQWLALLGGLLLWLAH